MSMKIVNSCTLKIRGGCYTLDEKMGQTYIHYEVANTLAARDYKQPQAVLCKKEKSEKQG